MSKRVCDNHSIADAVKKKRRISEANESRAAAIKSAVDAYYERKRSPGKASGRVSTDKAMRALANLQLGYPKRALVDAMESLCCNIQPRKVVKILLGLIDVYQQQMDFSFAKKTRSSAIAQSVLECLGRALTALEIKAISSTSDTASFMDGYRNALCLFLGRQLSQASESLEVCRGICRDKMHGNGDVLRLLEETEKAFTNKMIAIHEVESDNCGDEMKNALENCVDKGEGQNFGVIAGALLDKSLANLMLNESRLALMDADRCLLLESDNVMARLCKVIALLELNDCLAARRELEICIEFCPDDVNLLRLRGTVNNGCRRSIGRLPEDVLIIIFQMLPYREKFRVELVSRRWNALVVTYGWRFFRVFNDRGMSSNKCLSLFERGGRYMQEFWIREPLHSSIWSLLPMLGRLQHLCFSVPGLSASNIRTAADAFPALKSIYFASLPQGCFPGFTYLLDNCKQLEFVKLRHAEHFLELDVAVLPDSVKFLDVDHTSNCPHFLARAMEKGCVLEALRIYAWVGPALLRNSFYFTSIKYLSVYVNEQGSVNFAQALVDLPNLRALDVSSAMDGQGTLELLRGIVCEAPHLEHLGLSFHLDVPAIVIQSDLAPICALRDLASFSLSGSFRNEAGLRLCLEDFLVQLAARGKLKYFNIKSQLSMESVCNALRTCRNLKRIGWRRTRDDEWPLLFRTLAEIHGVSMPEFEHQIVEVFCFCNTYCWPLNTPRSPWVKFCAALPSPVRENYRLRYLSSVPGFVTD